MIVFEAKLIGTSEQYQALDEALRTARFVRNSCLRYWLDNKGVDKYDLNKYCAVLAKEFEWAKKLNSMARQASAERVWSAISRFFDNCKKKIPGKKGFPRFKKHQTHASVEYKTTGWKLALDRRSISFTDGFDAGTFKMWGTRDLHYYQIEAECLRGKLPPQNLLQIKRVRVVRRADGYYTQFCVDVERVENHELTGRNVGIDVGLTHFLTDSDGNTIENPRFLRKDEKALHAVQRRVSRKKKGSKNRIKARNRLGRKHLLIQRRRKDFVVKTARCVIQSSDLVAIEDLKVRNMVRRVRSCRLASESNSPVRNHHLAKSISDAAWSQFREWLEYFGKVFGVPVIAVAPQYTSQNCSNCGVAVKKTLSTRTHKCTSCGHIQDRDHNAATNILKKALQQLSKQNTEGHSEINVSGETDLCLVEVPQLSKPTRGKRKHIE